MFDTLQEKKGMLICIVSFISVFSLTLIYHLYLLRVESMVSILLALIEMDDLNPCVNSLERRNKNKSGSKDLYSLHICSACLFKIDYT